MRWLSSGSGRVELAEPAAELRDRAVAVAEDRVGLEDLVLPDRHVLLDLARDLVGQRLGHHLLRGVHVLALDEAEAQVHGLAVDRRRQAELDGVEQAHEALQGLAGAEVRGLEQAVAPARAGAVDVAVLVHVGRLADVAREALVRLVRDLAARNLLRGVHVDEVRGVGGVLGGFLDRGAECPLVYAVLRPVRVTDLGDGLDLEGGRDALGVVPGPDDLVALHHRVGKHGLLAVGARRHVLRVGDVLAHALAAELPGVERAGDVLALHLAAVAEVRAQVGAERIEQAGFAALGAEQHQLLAEVLQRLHLAGGELARQADRVPAEGNGKIVALAHGLSPASHCVVVLKSARAGPMRAATGASAARSKP